MGNLSTHVIVQKSPRHGKSQLEASGQKEPIKEGKIRFNAVNNAKFKIKSLAIKSYLIFAKVSRTDGRTREANN